MKICITTICHQCWNIGRVINSQIGRTLVLMEEASLSLRGAAGLFVFSNISNKKLRSRFDDRPHEIRKGQNYGLVRISGSWNLAQSIHQLAHDCCVACSGFWGSGHSSNNPLYRTCISEQRRGFPDIYCDPAVPDRTTPPKSYVETYWLRTCMDIVVIAAADRTRDAQVRSAIFRSLRGRVVNNA